MRTRQPSEKIIENKRTRERNRQALFYHQRKSEGLCVDCGKQARPGMTQCQQCYEIKFEKQRRNRQERKRKAVQYLGGKCVDCGLQTDFMSVYDFHHKDAETKSDRVAELISHYRSWEIVQAELDKCILLCSNCHRIRHELEDNASIF